MRVYILNKKNEVCSQGKVYRFRSKRETILWPMQDGVFLGAVGAWNFLFRLGLQPEYCTISGLNHPKSGDLLFVFAENESLGDDIYNCINQWLANGVTVIASGLLPAWKRLLPTQTVVEQVRCEYPYAALAWNFGDGAPELIAPPLWSYGRLIISGKVQAIGKLLAVRGERQTPSRALITPLENAPALIRYKNFIYLNGNPFAALQAWLQGQEDLGPWLQWRHRLFWLDEQVAFLLEVLNEYAQLPLRIVPRLIPGLPETVVVLRHDLDHSRDTSYLDAEREIKMPGVHAVLRDGNANFWIKTLRDAPEHEASFHYATANYSRWFEWIRSKVGLAKRLYSPARNLIAGNGLLRQVRWAKKKGVGIKTLHRHQPFLIYPEWVDALDYVFKKEPEVLGGSSLFRGQVLRWGCNRTDGVNEACGVFPDVQFPYWFPCKLAHAGLEGKSLRGWEIASVMEIEPEFFEQLLDYRVPSIPQRVITINYHPAHAKKSTFRSQGSLFWWKEILCIIRKRGIEIRTLQEIYSDLDNITVK